jgi:hypothetical protein
MLRVILVALFLGPLLSSAAPGAPVQFPNTPDSVKFAVFGDSGTGDQAQRDIARQMSLLRQRCAFDLVLMVGDNFLGSQKPADLLEKFDRPYAALLQAGVRFQAVLGNHDEPHTIHYKPLNMNGKRYYSFTRGSVRFFALDSNTLDALQLVWLERTLRDASERWKIAYFHHALYSNSARHGSNVDIRVILEPLFIKHGVNAAFSGHDHVYERLTPQKDIQYFVSGAAGRLRKGDIRRSNTTAAAFDEDQSFMIVEIAGDQLFFEAVSRTGRTVDSGVLPNRNIPRISGTEGKRP